MNGPTANILSLMSAATLTITAAMRAAEDPSAWTIYITNDNCPDYTWGLTEGETRQSFADIVRGHLDEMSRTDGEAPEGRDRYNMAVTQEALCFIERYPGRKDELIRRLKEGRLYLSPFLCNSLWAFQSAEGVIRTFYPARRLEREWGIPMDVAEHIELPSLPSGLAAILPGCGIRWLSVPFYAYDSTFGGLRTPPAFILKGPDSSQLRVILDPWASGRSSYTQGAAVLAKPESIEKEWLPHYGALGAAWPLKAILASGTHGDISPSSGGQARGFAEGIVIFNLHPGPHPRLVNAILPQFCEALDRAQAEKSFLEVFGGDFGHSWDLWPVSLAKHAAGMREGERKFLAAEALIAISSLHDPGLSRSTRADRERAEWCWAMLSDHAWNGTDDSNKRHNAELRKSWSDELGGISENLFNQGIQAGRSSPAPKGVLAFNGQSFPRTDLVRIVTGRHPVGTESQVVLEQDQSVLCFVARDVPGFGLVRFPFEGDAGREGEPARLRASDTEIEGPFYKLTVDIGNGGIKSLIHKASGAELVSAGGRSLCETVYFDGKEHLLSGVRSEKEAEGPVLARLRISGTAGGIAVVNRVTVYAELDRVDFDLRILKSRRTVEERLCQVFPVSRPGSVLRIETTGAVIRPRMKPEGDLLPGADPRRFAVQGFIDSSPPEGPGVTIAPLDAFALRLDLDPLTFEALGNDQNYKEVSQDQGDITDFRFRYSLQAHQGPYDQAASIAWSRGVASPLLAAVGGWPDGIDEPLSFISVDPRRAVATCLKPADGDGEGLILRLQEVAGVSGPVPIVLKGFRRALRTDLLERDQGEIPIGGGKVELPIKGNGFGAVRLLR